MFDYQRSKVKKILLLFLILGGFLRFIYFDKITFFYDQARDAFEAINIIANHHLKLLGPMTDIPGLFHGPLYWYLLSPIYFFTQGNVIMARIFFILLSLLNIVLIFFLARKLFRNNNIALLSSFLLSISFETTQYSRWLSNPAPVVLTVGLFFYGLWAFLEKESWGFPLLLLGWGLSIQFQFFFVYEIILILLAAVFVLLQKKKSKIIVLNKLNIFIYGMFLLSISTFAVAEIKFRLQGIKALLGFFFQRKSPMFDLYPKLINFFHSLVANVRNNIINNQTMATLVLLALFVFVGYSLIKKNKFKKQLIFLSIWFLSPVILYFIEGTNAYFLNLGNVYPLILLVVYFLYELLMQKTTLLKVGIFVMIFFIIIASNINLIIKNNSKGETLFAIQQEMLLPYQQRVVDWIYQESRGKQFAINSVTNPLFINSTWAYQFDYYGKRKYGYMPMWLGYPQQDYAGGDVHFADINNRQGKLLFLIIEPAGGIPLDYIQGYKDFENIRSKLIKTKKIGNFTVEERKLINDIDFSRDKVFELVTSKK